MADRMLASVQKIIEIREIPGADNIALAVIRGWQCIVLKNELKVGDLVIYVEIDSVLPEKPEFEFLRPRCFVDNGVVKGFRIRTMKLRSCLSQGIIFPLSIISLDKGKFKEGMDLTAWMGIVKYERPGNVERVRDYMPKTFIRKWVWIIKRKFFSKEKRGYFPSWMPKTDENRLQSNPEILERYKNEVWYISEKMDGSSATFAVKDNIFYVCSRTLVRNVSKLIRLWKFKTFSWTQEGKLSDADVWNKIAKQYNMEARLRRLNRNISLQGEIIGEGIQSNKYKLKGQRFCSFCAFDIEKHQYLSYDEWIGLIAELNKDISATELPIETVPILNDSFVIGENKLEDFLKMADGISILADTIREGLVFRIKSADVERGNKLSFKVVSNKFLLEYPED